MGKELEKLINATHAQNNISAKTGRELDKMIRRSSLGSLAATLQQGKSAPDRLSALSRVEWAAEFARGGLVLLRDFESLEEDIKQCFVLMQRRDDADSILQLIGAISRLVKKYGETSPSVNFVYCAAVLELSLTPTTLLDDDAAFVGLQALLKEALSIYGFFWPRSYAVLEMLSRLISFITPSQSLRRRAQMHLLLLREPQLGNTDGRIRTRSSSTGVVSKAPAAVLNTRTIMTLVALPPPHQLPPQHHPHHLYHHLLHPLSR